MKSKVFLSVAAAILLLPSLALAVPYASQIRVSMTSTVVGSGLTISYYLNEDADSVLIEVVDEASTVVASFAGTATKGANSVVWDGTVDNAGGEAVAAGTGFSVQITADADKPEGWDFFAINQVPFHEDYEISDIYWNEGPREPLNPRNLFYRFRPHSVTVPSNPESDSFGWILYPSSESTLGWTGGAPEIIRAHAGLILLNADLSPPPDSNGGLDTRTLRHPSDVDPDMIPGFQDVFHAVEDPFNPDYYFLCGQGVAPRTQMLYGHVFDIEAEDANPNQLALSAPRAIAIVVDGSDRYMLLASGNNVINRAVISATNTLEGPLVNILGVASPTQYSKHIYLDSSGNLYWVSRDEGGSALGGRVYRWPASVVLAADTAGSLTEANADWVFTTSGIDRLQGVTELPNGDMVLICSVGLINIGNVADVPVAPDTQITRALTEADPFFAMPPEAGFSIYGVNLYSDLFGNLYLANLGVTAVPRAGFVAAGLSPGGQSSTTVNAPLSQVFRIETISDVDRDTWSDYR